MTTTPPATASPTLTEVTGAIERLVAERDMHTSAAAAITATLAELRKRLAATGPRAGAKARTGRKRKADRALPFTSAEPAAEM